MEKHNSSEDEQKSEKQVDAVTSTFVTSPQVTPAAKKPKTSAERQREYRLRQKQKIINNPEARKKTPAKKIDYQREYRLRKKREKAQKIDGDKPAKKSRADYQREYRQRKKRNAELNSDSAGVVPRQEEIPGTSGYLAPAPTTQLTPSTLIFFLNCQNLREHARDLRGNIIQKSHALMLSETWLRNGERVEIENFSQVTQFRRPIIKRGGGVGIYPNVGDAQPTFTVCDDTALRRNCQHVAQTKSDCGDICAARCTLPNGEPIVLVTVYISINQNIKDIIDFLHGALLVYTEGGSKLLKKRYHELPVLLDGDFNIHFDEDDGLRLIQFLKEDLNLDLVSGRTRETTRYGTTIVFSRFVTYVPSDVHVSYCS